jgi:SAM-dependent methyltransferase
MEAEMELKEALPLSRQPLPLQDLRSSQQLVAQDRCPVCGGLEWNYVMHAHGLTFFSCENCRLMRLHPQPSARTVHSIKRVAAENLPDTEETPVEELERARNYWMRLRSSLGKDAFKSNVLLVSSEPDLIRRVGYDVGFQQIEVIADVASSEVEKFDACLAVFALERMDDPAEGIARLHRLLKAGARLLLVVPLLDSWPARFCRDAWTELRPENRFYFSADTLRAALLGHGFDRLWLEPDRRRYTIAHLERRSRFYPSTWFTRTVEVVCRLVPSFWRHRFRVPIATSAFLLAATKADLRSRPKLSIIMPVYNEVSTFEQCFKAVRDKNVDGLDKDIIVVESNSSDGTREVAQKICAGDGVRLILQDRAAGKGNAVRAGLAIADGDIVLIQDADLEYDVDDYDELVKPILQRRAALVLGSRHTGSWKMRKFNDQPLVASFFNLGHFFFCTSLNLLFGQAMKDPFTMFKVFQRDCLHGLDFECDRFDFDFEILMKLLRKGYKPLELPVNYRARSLAEGKKVTVVRDPLTWLRALVKYRFTKISRPPF